MVWQVCGIVYVQTREPPLWNPTVWQAIFLVINLYQTSKLLLESYGEVRLSAEQQDVYEKLFLQHGLTPRQFSKLCGSARWSTRRCARSSKYLRAPGLSGLGLEVAHLSSLQSAR